MTRPEVLVPAKCLTHDPERDRNGYKEQAETNWTSPAKPRTPRAPMFQALCVAPAVLLFVVLGSFALICHSYPLLFDESLSPDRFDDIRYLRKHTHSSKVVLVSVHVVRRMSGAWVQCGTTTLWVFKQKITDETIQSLNYSRELSRPVLLNSASRSGSGVS